MRQRIRTINFFNTKAKNVIALSRRLVEEFGGEVPRSVEVLETLPGVGRKTASVVVNVAFGVPRIAVDTHIFRVANRIPLVATQAPLETQAALEAVVPKEFLLHAHHWLILHGRYVCKARKPECWRCLVADLCRYPEKTPAPGADQGFRQRPAPGMQAITASVPLPSGMDAPSSEHDEAREPGRSDHDPPPPEGREAVPGHVGQKSPHHEERRDEGGDESGRDEGHVVEGENPVVLQEIVREGARHGRHGEEEREFGGRALLRAEQHGTGDGCAGARHARHHGGTLD